MPLLPPAVTLTLTRRSKLRIVESFQVMKRFIFSEPSVTPVSAPSLTDQYLRSPAQLPEVLPFRRPTQNHPCPAGLRPPRTLRDAGPSMR